MHSETDKEHAESIAWAELMADGAKALHEGTERLARAMRSLYATDEEGWHRVKYTSVGAKIGDFLVSIGEWESRPGNFGMGNYRPRHREGGEA